MGKEQKKLANIFRLFKKIIDENEEYKKEIYNEETEMIFNSRILFTIEGNETDYVAIIFEDGNIEIIEEKIDDPSVKFIFKTARGLGKLSRTSSQEIVYSLLNNKIQYIGSLSDVTKFFFLLSYILLNQKDDFEKRQAERKTTEVTPFEDFTNWDSTTEQMTHKHLGYKVDNVKYLDDPYLSKYNLKDFKRLNYLKYHRFNTQVEVCPERAKLITEFARKEGYTPEDGNNNHPGLKMGKLVKYILSNKEASIQDWDYLPGMSTTKQRGALIYPEFGAIIFWPELYSADSRELYPQLITQESIDILNREVFPYWADRCLREYARQMTGNKLSQQLDELFVFYFMWKTQAISHTIPGFKTFFKRGLDDIIQKAKEKEEKVSEQDKKDFYKGIQLACQGVLTYSNNLANEIEQKAAEIDEKNASDLLITRKSELQNISRILHNVPANPPETLEEAIISLWIMWLALTMENAHMGLSLGRLDMVLQPFFVSDMEKIESEEEKEEYIKKAVELIGSFFLRCSDQEPLLPDIGNYLFGGSGQDFAITVGGVDSEGVSVVCDMTFIILKVTEMLSIRDPNLNARYYPGINSKEYLDRLLEVNINTHATPSIHNDIQMIKALTKVGFKLEDARGWAATGCVEPTICGKHFGHTNSMMFNAVAAMEMTLNNGYHPVVSMKRRIGPETGDVAQFQTFNDFINAYKAQLHFLVENSVECNNNLGKAHQILHPSPLLSSLFEGPMEKGKDLVDGGAIYNTSGVAVIGIADIIDTLKVVKTIVYDEREIDFTTLNEHVRNDFSTPEGELLLKRIKTIKKFGTGDKETIEIGQKVIDFLYDDFYSYENYRGGRYLTGFWSMSNHVAFGTLSGALPNGRKANKPFTPGLTPTPGGKDLLIQNIQSVAALDTDKMPNNLAFNIKLVPNPNDSHEETLNHFNGYTSSYFDLGGMQIQFNVVSTDTLRDAMEHPEDYGWLIVRISGYNAYFTQLNKYLQLELIERQEFVTH
ncbi:MAG: pyruvate formate lyase family protein [Candidatus Lokiarchaeia archaeon]